MDATFLSYFRTSLLNSSRFALNDGYARLRILSNSVDLISSRKNVVLGREFGGLVYPFVGIHPEVLRQENSAKYYSESWLEELRTAIASLISYAFGMGEIGMDPTYGCLQIQKKLFETQLAIAEATPSLPVCIHSRNFVPQICDILSTLSIRNRMLFHWFSGSVSELSRIQSMGYFVSFGPALIYSKSLQNTLMRSDEFLIMAETDSPLVFRSLIADCPITPCALLSVIFKMSQIRKMKLQDMLVRLEENTNEYLRAQNSLRV
jgi:TatD DNase family protein